MNGISVRLVMLYRICNRSKMYTEQHVTRTDNILSSHVQRRTSSVCPEPITESGQAERICRRGRVGDARRAEGVRDQSVQRPARSAERGRDNRRTVSEHDPEVQHGTVRRRRSRARFSLATSGHGKVN